MYASVPTQTLKLDSVATLDANPGITSAGRTALNRNHSDFGEVMLPSAQEPPAMGDAVQVCQAETPAQHPYQALHDQFGLLSSLRCLRCSLAKSEGTRLEYRP